MTNSFQDLKRSYTEGSVAKPDFIKSAHYNFHRILLDYAQVIQNTDIASVTIRDGSVMMRTKLDDISFVVNPLDHRQVPIEILNFNHYERVESALVRLLAPHIHTMLDIGSNIGWYSLLVHAANPSADIHAFEPIPATFNQLLNSCELNNANNIHCHNYGLSSEPGSFPFYFYPEGSGNASVRNLASREDAQVIECELRTLEQFQDELPSDSCIDFIKCDVEGNELFVLQGAASLLHRHKPIILMELLRKWCEPFSYHPNDVFSLLSDIGYVAYTIDSDNVLRPVIGVTDETQETNFVFTHPGSRLRAILGV